MRAIFHWLMISSFFPYFIYVNKVLILVNDAMASIILIRSSSEFTQQLKANPKIDDICGNMSSICLPYSCTKLRIHNFHD